MSDNINSIQCPVCGEPVEVGAEQAKTRCPECGAMLTTDIIEKVRQDLLTAVETETKSVKEAPAALSDEATDELLLAFRNQFERHEVRLPKEWVDRLRRLATETESGRRQATIFFADLRGYTRLSQVLDEIQLDRLRQWFYEVCTRRVELHGGFVIQFLGDAVYAAFGAPWAFERDAESALRALLDIREDIRRKGTFEGHELAIRAGADTGTVNVRLTEEQGRARPDLFGSPVNLAARLEAIADTWEILVSDTLAAQVRGLFELEKRPAWTPKNYNREVIPYAVVKHKGEDAVRRRNDIRFVGRNAEINVIRGWVQQATQGGFVAARLTGEAGIGKTRLVDEVIQRNGLGRSHWAKVGCEPHDRHVLLGAMIKLLHRIAQWASGFLTGETMSPEAVFSALAGRFYEVEPYVLPSVGYILGVEPHASAIRSLPAKELKAQVVSSLTALIRAACRTSPPWVVFIDDSQWLDRLSWEVVDAVVKEKPAGLLLMVSGRLASDQDETESEVQSIDQFVEKTEGTAWRKINLESLPETDRVELVGEVLDLGKLHPHLRNRLLQETEGIPLYMLELARDIAENPDKSLADLVESRKDDGLGISEVIIDILQARVDKLSRQRRALLQCGAVLGRRFDLKVIKMFEAMHAELLGELYALKGLRLLRDEPLPEDISFFFTPTVLRDVAYRMLNPEQKMALHRTVAEQIEKRYPEHKKIFAYELAIHWIRGGDVDRARPYLRRAAQKAMDQGASQEAYELVQLALNPSGMSVSKEASPAPAESESLALQQTGLIQEIGGRACRLLGDYEKADRHFLALADIARKIENPLWEANSQFQRGITLIETGNLPEAEKLLASVPAGLEGGSELLARAKNALGIIQLRTGRLQEALSQFQNLARDLSEGGKFNLTAADAWNNTGLVQWHLGNMVGSREAFSMALEIWQRLGNLYGQVSTLSNLGIAAEKLGKFTEAASNYAKASQLAEQIGYLHGISAIESNRANLSLLRQKWGEAQEQSAKALQAARLIHHKESETISLENLGLALGGLGQLEEAVEVLKQAAELGIEMNNPMRRDSARLACASVAFHHGDASFAEQCLMLLPSEISPDLQSWRETLRTALQIFSGSRAEAQKFVASLDEIQRGASMEDYLRRLDAVVYLCDRGVLSESKEPFLARRQLCFQENGHAKAKPNGR